MASRYHMLPTEVLHKATTVDYYIHEQALEYLNKAADPTRSNLPDLSQEEMQAMLDAVRNGNEQS